jgi:hypothetical protein
MRGEEGCYSFVSRTCMVGNGSKEENTVPFNVGAVDSGRPDSNRYDTATSGFSSCSHRDCSYHRLCCGCESLDHRPIPFLSSLGDSGHQCNYTINRR